CSTAETSAIEPLPASVEKPEISRCADRTEGGPGAALCVYGRGRGVTIIPAPIASSKGLAVFWPGTAIRLLTCLLLCWLCAFAPAAPALSGERWQILVDDSARLSLEDVRQLEHRFQPLDRNALHFPNSSHAVWLRVNTRASHEPRWIWLFAPRVQYLDYYLFEDGQLLEQVHTGEARAINS